MPQLDRIILLHQIFWLVFVFIFIYFFTVVKILPTITKIFKSRFFIIQSNLEFLNNLKVEELEFINNFQRILYEGMILSRKLVSKNFSSSEEKFNLYSKEFFKLVNLNKTLFRYLYFYFIYKNKIFNKSFIFPILGSFSKKQI
uniref:ATP synthase F0 subunit 8 n=1 Tax=Cyanidium caldarium TaxID=2771 RepID=A0A7H0WBC1_CYACA|nr:ATP synthase F0 subunit 8 [Cyanidium caldarium]QNR39850.1 ATP synthase F0 subunit 8 [Cyanidium caldarium]